MHKTPFRDRERPRPTSTPAQGQNASEGQGTRSNSGDAVDIAATFPSWDPESASLAELVAFVEDVTDSASPNYRDPSERIATFDMDGTLICEKAPIYVDYMLLLHRVLDDPDHKAAPDVVKLCESIEEYALRGEKSDDSLKNRGQINVHSVSPFLASSTETRLSSLYVLSTI